MLRRVLASMAVLGIATAWYWVNLRDDPAVDLLNKVDALMDAGNLDYAAATKFLGMPLDVEKSEMIVNGSTVNARAAEYGIARNRSDPPGLTRIDFEMVWQAENNPPLLRAWHREKGLRSHFRLSFDPKQICITKAMLWMKFGWTMPGGSSHGESVSLLFGDKEKLFASFTFNQSECASNVYIRGKNAAATWSVPADASANDSEFVTRLLPLDKSGKQLDALGLACGPANSPSSEPDDTGCVCGWDKQTPAGPCHYSVNLSTLKEGGMEIRVLALPDRGAN